MSSSPSPATSSSTISKSLRSSSPFSVKSSSTGRQESRFGNQPPREWAFYHPILLVEALPLPGPCAVQSGFPAGDATSFFTKAISSKIQVMTIFRLKNILTSFTFAFVDKLKPTRCLLKRSDVNLAFFAKSEIFEMNHDAISVRLLWRTLRSVRRLCL